jgi:hypothetical protein
MKRNTLVIVIAVALMLLVGIVGFAYSEGNSAPAKNCATACPKFVDNNKDGVCDSMAVHHKDGKCTGMAQCMKDGRCQGNCKNHAGAMKTSTSAGTCDPTKCATMPNGCPMKAKAACKGSK